MSSRADFLAQDGWLKDAKNIRFDSGVGAIRINSNDLVREITELDSTKDYERIDLDDSFVVATVELGSVKLRCFNSSDGIEGTIDKQRTIPFTVGSGDFKAGDGITGDTSGATAILQGIKHSSGSFADGNAAGSFVFWVTSGSFAVTGENITNNDTSATATITNDGTEIDFSYLGSDSTKIRFTSAEDSVLVLNVDTEITTSDAPPGTVKKKVADYIQLLKQFGAVVDDIYETIAAGQGRPSGHYQCTKAGDKTAGDPPQFKAIPKPGQADAVYDASTFIHRLKRVKDSPLVMLWEELPVSPRLSGGDVEGFEETTGVDIILNRPLLKGRKIRAMAFMSGPSRLVLGTDAKELIPSAAGDFFNYWLRDVYNIAPDDRIIEEIVVPNSGQIEYIVAVGEALFVQMQKVHVQYAAMGEGILIAGGEQTPYNGRALKIGEHESAGIPPVAEGRVVSAMNANKELRAYFFDSTEGVRSLLPLDKPVNSEIFDDFVQDTIIRLEIAGTILYAVTSAGKAWRFQTTSTESFRPQGSWSYLDFDEPIVHLWGLDDTTRFLTRHENYYSLLKMSETEITLPTGFSYEPRLDRREQVIADNYDSANDKTTFTIQTDGDLSRTYLILRFELARVRFDQGATTISVNDTITQDLDDANHIPATSAVVYAVNVESGSFGGGDAAGFLDVYKTTFETYEFTDQTLSDPVFIDNQPIKVGGSQVAVVDGEEEQRGAIGETRLPTDVSGKVVKFKGQWETLAHYIGRSFVSRIELPKQWADISRAQFHIVTTTIFHDRTTDYIVRFLEDGRTYDANADDFQFVSKFMGETFHDQTPIDTDQNEVFAGASGKDLRLQILSDSPGQFRISGIVFQADRTDF